MTWLIRRTAKRRYRIYSTDFSSDAALELSGDFASELDEQAFAADIARQLTWSRQIVEAFVHACDQENTYFNRESEYHIAKALLAGMALTRGRKT